MSLSREQALLEYAKCVNDTPYALKTYLQTYDNTQSKYVPLELFNDQVTLVKDYDECDENIALKYRQAGVSTVTSAWASKRLVFARKEKPEKILIIANKMDTAVEMANKVRAFVEQWPKWMGVGFSAEKNSQRHFKLTNGCEVKAVATSKDALRGYTPTILIFDEAAYINADEDFWSACMASLSTGGKVIVISTPNGFDPIYYSIYSQAIKGMNDFRITEMYWFRDPRYSKDLKLIKCSDIVHYMLNRAEYNDSDITLDYSDIKVSERDFNEIKQKIEGGGYKAYSSWFEAMAKKLKFDRRKISQELECNFLGSGDNVIPPETMKSIKDNHIKEPEKKLMGGAIWQWKEPVAGHRYIMGMDVSRGDSEDFTTFIIIDFDEREQVLEYIAKVPPDVVAEIAYRWATMYNAFIVTDITGGMGVATSRKLQELGYKSLYVDGVNPADKWKWDPKSQDKIPGINFNSKRVQIVAAFEEALRHDFGVRSQRLFNELNTFVYINGKPDHQKGQHDDLIMAMAMALYVAETSFSKLEKATEQAKAMLESWSVETNNYTGTYTNFNPGTISTPSQNDMYGRSQVTKSDYEKYLWLFGSRRV
jgi:phage FluMu gp28-like protein